MALKSDRYEIATDPTFYMNEVGARGGIVSFSTFGSGAALDQAAALVTYAAVASGSKPAGMLLNDMVNLDLTRQHQNYHKDEVQKGGKVTLGTKGWWNTDQITSGITIAVGDRAYLGNGGRITNAITAGGDANGYPNNPVVGRFLSKLDEDGFAKVEINLP